MITIRQELTLNAPPSGFTLDYATYGATLNAETISPALESALDGAGFPVTNAKVVALTPDSTWRLADTAGEWILNAVRDDADIDFTPVENVNWCPALANGDVVISAMYDAYGLFGQRGVDASFYPFETLDLYSPTDFGEETSIFDYDPALDGVFHTVFSASGISGLPNPSGGFVCLSINEADPGSYIFFCRLLGGTNAGGDGPAIQTAEDWYNGDDSYWTAYYNNGAPVQVMEPAQLAPPSVYIMYWALSTALTEGYEFIPLGSRPPGVVLYETNWEDGNHVTVDGGVVDMYTFQLGFENDVIPWQGEAQGGWLMIYAGPETEEELPGTHAARIEGNTFTGAGVTATDVHNLLVAHNTFSDGTSAVSLTGCNDAHLVGNTVWTMSADGFLLDTCLRPLLRANRLQACGTVSGAYVTLTGCTLSLMAANRCIGSALLPAYAVVIDGGDENAVTENDFRDAFTTGSVDDGGTDSIVVRNLPDDLGGGVHDHDADYADIAHNHDLDYAPLAHTHALDDLSDVDAAAPTDGQALVWVDANSAWEPGTIVGGGGYTQEEIEDFVGAMIVDSTTINATYNDGAGTVTLDVNAGTVDADTVDGQHAAAFAAAGHNHDLDYADITHNHDLDYAPLTHNHDLLYSDINHNHDLDYAALTHTHALDDLSDVTAPTPADGQALVWSSLNDRWQPGTVAGGGGGGDLFAVTIGDGVETVYTVNHNLDSTDVLVQVWEVGGGKALVQPAVAVVDADNITITFTLAPDVDEFRVIVASTGGIVPEHDHDADYAPAAHNHDADYADVAHDHDSDYAPLTHNHDLDYADIAHVHALDDLSDVDAAAPADGDVLTWVEANNAWEAATPTGGTASGQYRQFVWEVSGGAFTFVTDNAGNPIFDLVDLE